MKIFAGTFNPNSFENQIVNYPSYISINYCANNLIFFESSASKLISSVQFKDQESQNVIIADATIFNKNEIILKLGAIKYKDISDIEIILHAYNLWGVKCLDHLIGDFVFAIWDEKQQELFLARDHVGLRTLFYYYNENEGLYFSNLIKPIFDLSNISKKFNDKRIAHYFSMQKNDGYSTFFQNIHKLPPAHFLIYSKSQHPIVKRYWSAKDVSQNKISLKNSSEYHEAFMEVYRQAINERCQDLDTTACYLSGGLDSSSVTCLTAQLAQQENITINSFGYRPTPGYITNPFKNFNYDDKYYMDLVCEKYKNIKLHYIFDDHINLFSEFQNVFPWLDEPPFNPFNLLWTQEIFRAANNLNVKTILSGSYGNITVSWSGMPFNNYRSKLKLLLTTLHKYINIWPMQRIIDNHLKDACAINPILAKRYDIYKNYHNERILLAHNNLDDRVYSMENFDVSNEASLLTTQRHLFDVEYFDPTGDKRIIEFCLRIPNELFRNAEGSRMLIRNSMKGIMPQEICERKTRGLQGADWYKKIDREKKEINEILHRWKTSFISNYIDIPHLIKLFKQWDVYKIANSQGSEYIKYENYYNFKLMDALTLGLFLEYHNQPS